MEDRITLAARLRAALLERTSKPQQRRAKEDEHGSTAVR